MNEYLQRRVALMRNRKINLILDVGANQGQYAEIMRQLGYRGRIVSFEPLPDAFQALQRKAAGDGQWECRNVALGDNAGNARINVSANSYSSSLLPVTDTALRLEPAIGYVGSENIVIERLDDIFDEIVNANDVPYLKVDTQGYELNVLRGGLRVLARFPLIQLETSFFSVYEGQVLVGDVIKFLDEIGYRIVSLEPGWNDPKTGELLEADLIFARK